MFAKGKGRCTFCGKPIVREHYDMCDNQAPPDTAWECEHWLPKSRGGTDDLDNLWPACCECNDEKDADTGEEYMLKRIDEEKPRNSNTEMRILFDNKHKGREPPTV